MEKRNRQLEHGQPMDTQVNRMCRSRRVLATGGKQTEYGWTGLAKEVGYYEKEAVREQARQDTMKNEGKDEYDIKKQAEVIAESMIMIPDTKRRLKKAHEDLQKVLETDKDLNETEEYKDAQVQLEEARKVIDAEQQS